MKFSIIGPVLVVLALVGSSIGLTQEKKPEPKKPTVMQRKLSHAEKVLQGLALADFEKIRAGSDDLSLCVQEASWKAVNSPKYEVYSNDMIRNLDAMKKAAKEKNVDAAALAYVDLTLTCVKCHKYVREEKIGALPNLGMFATHASN